MKSQILACVVIAGAALSANSPGAAEAGEPVSVQAAQRAFNDAYRQEDWPHAIDVGLELVQMVPENARFKYNLACAYALRGDASSALHWLGRAAASGFSDLSLLDGDSDLAIVRDRPGYPNVRAQVAENKTKRHRALDRGTATPSILIVTPSDLDRKEPAPLIVAFHGYGDRPENYTRFWSEPAGEYGAILAVPRGLRPVGNGFGWGSVDEADAILLQTIDEVKRRYEFDPDRLIVTGFSQGGFIALALGLRHPRMFAGVIPIAGPYIPEVDAPPRARRGYPRYFFMVGERDRSVSEMRRAARDYEAAGFAVRLRVLVDTGHNFPRESDRELSIALGWVLEDEK
jgi:phospholipase/carboxylesterase